MAEEAPPDAAQKTWITHSPKVCQSGLLPEIPVRQPPIPAEHQCAVALPSYECDQPDRFSGGTGGKEETLMNK